MGNEIQLDLECLVILMTKELGSNVLIGFPIDYVFSLCNGPVLVIAVVLHCKLNMRHGVMGTFSAV